MSPNTQKDDVLLAVKTMLNPGSWHDGRQQNQVKEWFVKNYNVENVYLFHCARSALYAVLQSFDIGKGDEVILQAFTCVAVPNSIVWGGAKPVYADIDASLNIDPIDIERKITPQTKALIVQHTFGMPAHIEDILALAEKYKLIVIEDCAHSLGVSYNGKYLGTFGDAAIFSFGRDKVVSSVCGGVAIIHAQRPVPNAIFKLKEFQSNLTKPPYFWIFQQIIHPIAFSIILMSYNIIIGKLLLVCLQYFHLLSKPIEKEELSAGKPKNIFFRFPNALATFAIHQLKKLVTLTSQRRIICDYYYHIFSSYPSFKTFQESKGKALLRFPLDVDDPNKLYEYVKKNGVLLGTWYQNVIDPAGVDYFKVGYEKGSCVQAEYQSRHIINLPTLLTRSQAQRVVQLVLKAYN